MGKPKSYPTLDDKQVERFWSKVDRSGGPDACWPWIAKAVTGAGRGIVRVNKQPLAASRVAFELLRGRLNTDALIFLSCSLSSCCNPKHMLVGSQSDAQAYAYRAKHGPPMTDEQRRLSQRVVDPITGAKPYPPLTEEDVDRFWSYVKRGELTGCWPWTGGCTGSGGYGVLNVNGRFLRAHRLVYILTHGSISTDKVVRHTCDNPPCCNPKHLILGTQLDNTADRKERMRCDHVRGERVHTAKLTQAQVDEIRRRLAAGELQEALAEEFGVHPASISSIKTGKTWSGVVRC